MLTGRRNLAALKTLVDVFFFPERCSCSRGRPAKQVSSLRKQTAMGLTIMRHRTGGKRCLCRYTSSPGLTLTRRRSVGRQGAPFPRTSRHLVVMRAISTNQSSPGGDALSARKQLQSTKSQQTGRRRWGMHGLENENNPPRNLKLKDGEEVGDGGEGARGERSLAKSLGDRAHHLLQPVDVRL